MQKNKYIFQYIESIFNNTFMHAFFLILLLVLGYFSFSLDSKDSYLNALVFSLTYQQFITLCFLPIIIFFDVLILNLFEKNNMMIIRFENKKKYLQQILKNVFYCNTVVFFIILMTILIFFNFFSSGNLSVFFVETFKTTNLIYAVFIVFKLYILMLIVSLILTLLFKIFNKIIMLIVGIGLTASIFLCQWIDYTVVEKVYHTPFYIGSYFIDNIEYKTFNIQLSSFLLIVILYTIIIAVLYRIALRHIRLIGE